MDTDECQTDLAQDFGLQCFSRLNFDRDQGRNETMAMMAIMWSVVCGLFPGQIHAKAIESIENEISDAHEGAP